ncbi:MAG: hypothetical protein DI628_04455 [Blastochloris viridis]|uniref:Uncharacterized protein n=1 Tax=Blastochloris viridis TaxID=1079 RepID=A0A6N4RDQ1_BLAVI|nr:MAG: hypothetical protein DI628_04455 [Blastochloris viridis]
MDIFPSSVFHHETGFDLPLNETVGIVVWYSPDRSILRQRALQAAYCAQTVCLVGPTTDDHVEDHDYSHWNDWNLLIQELEAQWPPLPVHTMPLDYQLRASVAAFYTPRPRSRYEYDDYNYNVYYNEPILRKDLLDDRPAWQKANDPALYPQRKTGAHRHKAYGVANP